MPTEEALPDERTGNIEMVPTRKRNYGGEVREVIYISPEAKSALNDFLYNDAAGTGEGFSKFILTAIRIRRMLAQLGL